MCIFLFVEERVIVNLKRTYVEERSDACRREKEKTKEKRPDRSRQGDSTRKDMCLSHD